MLKIEDLKAGDEIICIDREGFLKNGDTEFQEKILKEKHLIIHEICGVNLYLADKDMAGWAYICEAELKYFKKKEQLQQYTFDDLIDVAVQAKKDKLLGQVTIMHDAIHYFIDGQSFSNGECNAEKGIKRIKSLYKETFVIESEEDLKRVKLNPKITLNNGEVIPFSFKSVVKDHLIFYDQPCGHNMIPFVFLKGATVEQERGRDD